MATAVAEVSQVASEARNNRALRAKVPTAARLLVLLGHLDRIYRTASRIWEGPFTVSRIIRKALWVTDGTKVKPFPISMDLPP